MLLLRLTQRAAEKLAAAAVAHLERAGRDDRVARVRVAAGNRQNARAGLCQVAVAADGAVERRVAGVVENQRTVVGHRTGARAKLPARRPLPTCSVPPEIFVPPVYVFKLPVSVRRPGPACVRLPLPLMAPP